MKTIEKTIVVVFFLSFVTNPTFADWEVKKDPLGGPSFRVVNSENGKSVPTTYKKEKSAKKVAKLLNKKDKSDVIADKDGNGDKKNGFPH